MSIILKYVVYYIRKYFRTFVRTIECTVVPGSSSLSVNSSKPFAMSSSNLYGIVSEENCDAMRGDAGEDA